jgi:hypothetical protein
MVAVYGKHAFIRIVILTERAPADCWPWLRHGVLSLSLEKAVQMPFSG